MGHGLNDSSRSLTFFSLQGPDQLRGLPSLVFSRYVSFLVVKWPVLQADHFLYLVFRLRMRGMCFCFNCEPSLHGQRLFFFCARGGSNVACGSTYNHVGWDSVVGTVTGYGLDSWGLNPSGRNFLCLSRPAQWPTPYLLNNGYWGTFQG
jgi:hypothetical protein